MIVGTAGHIDHGKTTLVQALTGVDTDRLPEEKQRGISIELGYAFLDTPEGARIGFVDVPGHERLVHTMVAGATGTDFALLLVAADDGVMPQTREHLAVLSLLGLERGAVVVTKCDRVDAARVAAVVAEAEALIAGTPLAGSPVLPVAAREGRGIDALKATLFDAARDLDRQRREPGIGFRLAVDRAFTLAGVGTVATGSVHTGEVGVGDTLRLVPGTHVVRVRSVHAQNRAVERAGAGERCALGLVGIEREQIGRGQWLVAPSLALASDRFDVRLTLWREEARPLRSGTSVHLHAGAASVTATVGVLEPAVLEPGATGLVQLVLKAPIGIWRGDRIVLRDASATRTIAGGAAIDPFAPVRYRRTPQRLAELAALTAPDPAQRLAALLAAAPGGVDLARFRAVEGLIAGAAPIAGAGQIAGEGLAAGASDPLEPVLVADAAVGGLRMTDAAGDAALGALHARVARATLAQALAAFHTAHPDELGPDRARLRRLALPRLSEPLFRALLEAELRAGVLAQRGAFVHHPEHGVRLTANEERLAQRLAPLLAAAQFEGAWVRDLARDANQPESLVRPMLARLAQRGELCQVVRDLYYPPATMAELAALARAVAAAHDGAVTAALFRDATGLGRKRAIQILECFDRIGLLRRVGDVHRLRADSMLFR
ncbi:MAG: selenocysteine-specific translation elongation factor, partial [Lautropia sp.]